MPVVTKLRQERGPRISNCVGDERSLAQCFREPLLRLASGIAPLTGHDWEGHNDNDLQEREGAGQLLASVEPNAAGISSKCAILIVVHCIMLCAGEPVNAV